MSDSEALPDRRSFLLRSAATLAAGTLLAAEPHAPEPNSNASLTDFTALSSALIGVSVAKLAHESGKDGVASRILAAASKDDERLCARMLQAYRAHASEPADRIAEAVLNRSGEDVGFLAKSVMLAWLLGSWYAPADLQRAASQPAPGFVPSSVISADAYRSAWAWRIAQTKAMGTTTAGFGYWASPPAPLDDFIGGGR